MAKKIIFLAQKARLYFSEYIFHEYKAETLCWDWGVWGKFRACPRHDVPGIYIDRNFCFVKLSLQKKKENHMMKNMKMCKYHVYICNIWEKDDGNGADDNDDIRMGIKWCLSGYGQWGRWGSEGVRHDASSMKCQLRTQSWTVSIPTILRAARVFGTILKSFNPAYFTFLQTQAWSGSIQPEYAFIYVMHVVKVVVVFLQTNIVSLCNVNAYTWYCFFPIEWANCEHISVAVLVLRGMCHPSAFRLSEQRVAHPT